METIFYFVLNMKTVNGFESYGRFFIGNNKEFAHSVFHKLKGNPEIRESDILHIDLIETRRSLPVNIKMINCTLEELAENCKIITKEVFKFFNLEEI